MTYKKWCTEFGKEPDLQSFGKEEREWIWERVKSKAESRTIYFKH